MPNNKSENGTFFGWFDKEVFLLHDIVFNDFQSYLTFVLFSTTPNEEFRKHETDTMLWYDVACLFLKIINNSNWKQHSYI